MTIAVAPSISSLDQPLRITVGGLRAGEDAQVRVTSTDFHGVQWTARATYQADRHGRIDAAETPASGGSYPGVEAMGLIDAMQPPTRAAPLLYFWNAAAPDSFVVSVSTDQNKRASVTVRRRAAAPGVRLPPATTVAVDGFVGQFVAVPPSGGRRPAVVVLGGSEGGLPNPLPAAALASHGYATLDVAYFGVPSLPAKLEAIPLEYFRRAITWLGRQPGVDSARITVMGASRGSEAAILLAQHYPDLVRAAIALVPSNVALSSPDGSGPAWTFAGAPVPFTRHKNEVTPTDAPDALLPVSDIGGPVLLACGGVDQVWTSCPYAEALTKRLDAAAPGVQHRLLHFSSTGHSIGFALPYEPGTLNSFGGSPQADRVARADLWPQLLAFLGRT